MPGNESVVVGVDVGGTKILIGCVTQDGRICYSQRYPIDRGSQTATLESLNEAVDRFFQSGLSGLAPSAVGIGVVGHTDPINGIWMQSINMHITKPIPLASQIETKYQLPTVIDNDVHAATLAELRLGAGQRVKHFVYINIGTGLSAGIVCDGRLVRGTTNYAGELGHTVVEAFGDLCPCGHRGCLEPIASGSGMISQVKNRLTKQAPSHPELLAQEGQITSQAIFQAADAGDKLATEVADRALRGLRIAMVNLVNLLNPEMIVLGGGVLRDGWLLPRLRAYTLANALPTAVQSLKAIEASKLDVDKVGLLGAASIAWEHLASTQAPA